MKKQVFKKLQALLLTFILTASMCNTVFATEYDDPVSVEEIAIENVAELNEEKVAAELESAVAELSSLTPGEDYVDGEGVFIADSEEEAERIAKEYGGSLKSFNNGAAVVRFEGSTIDAFNAAAESLSASKAVDPNYICTILDDPNDPLASPLYDETYYQYFHDKIHTLSANQVTAGNGVKIAVLDSGCTPDHEDSKFDDEHCQYISSFTNGTDKSVGHGIHCTGIIHETKNNSLGGYGVASEAEVYSIKITGAASFNTDAVIEGIGKAIDDNVDVISLSVGTTQVTTAMQEIVDKAYESGITIVAAAGNDGANVKNYPAACDHVISVAATDKDDKLAKYSNYGDWVDIAAPGSNIISTYLYGTKATNPEATSSTDSYGIQSGTSMATPIVAGVAALIYGANPDFCDINDSTVPDTVKQILLDTADGREYSYEDHSVKGLVQADKAVNAAKELATNSKYVLTDKTGIRSIFHSGLIAKGKTIQLQICEKNGNTKEKEMKELTKKTVWSSDKPSILTVKNGKVKCSKKASIGSEATVTATIDGCALKYKFTVSEPLVGSGLTIKVHYVSGKTKLKIKTSIPVKVKTGTEISLSNPYKIYNEANNKPEYWAYVNLVFSKKKKRLNDGTWGVGANDNYKYAVKVPEKKIKNGSIKYETLKNGKPEKIVINKKGKYTVTFAPLDGSGKSFSYVFKAE